MVRPAGGDDGPAEDFLEFVVIDNRQSDVTRRDLQVRPTPVVPEELGQVAGRLQDLRHGVLQHGGQVDGGQLAHPVAGVGLPEVPVDLSHWEQQARPPGPRDPAPSHHVLKPARHC